MTLLPERKWTPNPAIGSPGWTNGSRGQSDSALGTIIDPIEASVRQMGQVRTFVSELLGDLTDRQWEELCAGARGASSEEDGITRVVLRATALLEPTPAHPAPVVAGAAPPPAADVVAPTPVAEPVLAASEPVEAATAAPPAVVEAPYDLLPIPPGFGASATRRRRPPKRSSPLPAEALPDR